MTAVPSRSSDAFVRGMRSRRGIDRRDFLKGSLLAAGGLALAGCGSPLAAGLAGSQLPAETVEYWNLFGGGDGVRMTEMLDKFKADNPDLTLQATTLTWGNPYYTKLALATVGNLPPDVAVSHMSRLPTLVGGGLTQAISSDDLSKHGLSADKFDQRAWKGCQFDGETHAIPLDTHPFVLFYNTDICKKAGLLDSDGSLKSMDGPTAFTDAMAACQKAGAQWGAVCAVNNDTSTNWRIFESLYAQLGGQVLADDGTKVVLDQDKVMKVLNYLKSLTDNKLMPGDVDYGGAVGLFASGGSGFFLQGEWEIATFQTAKMPFSMTLFPNVFGGKYAVQGDSHTLLIPKANDDPTRTDTSLRFIASLLGSSLTWAEGGHIPAWLPVRDSEAYKKLTPQSNYAAAAEATVTDPPAWYSGSGSTFELAIGSPIATVRAGQASPSSAYNQMVSALQTLADTPSPV
jgi:multiple sugar transport system substrate-binding protein